MELQVAHPFRALRYFLPGNSVKRSLQVFRLKVKNVKHDIFPDLSTWRAADRDLLAGGSCITLLMKHEWDLLTAGAESEFLPPL